MTFLDMPFGDYLFIALLYTGLSVMPPAIMAAIEAARHYFRATLDGHPFRTVTIAWYSMILGIYICTDAFGEILSNGGRIWHIADGRSSGSGGIVTVSSLIGISSLSLVIYVLNQKSTKWLKIYWAGHCLIFTLWLIGQFT